jgi:2-polyprenyl-3-methyl-5-hydroxy-6-metoxy-1,4-benzoquinol methylase
LYHCDHCGSAYLDPRPTPETIGLAYQSYFTHVDDQPVSMAVIPKSWANFRQSLRNGYLNARYKTTLLPAQPLGRLLLPLVPPLRERADRWVRHLPPSKPGSRLLEIGCGNGSFLTAMRQLGWEVHGLEPDAKAAQVARSKNIPVVAGTLDSSTFPEASFDAISLHHVIEHLHNPMEVLEICLRLLRPSGVISIITPNFSSRGSKIYKQNWYHLDPPRHLALFTTQSLVQAMVRAGYRDVVAHASFFGAASIFQDSAKLQANNAGALSSDFGKLKNAWVRAANLFSSLNPHGSEEAVVTAHKPA